MAKNGTCKVYVDGKLNQTVIAKNCTNTSVNITGLSEGDHNISVVCNDSAGNIYPLPYQTIHIVFPTEQRGGGGGGGPRIPGWVCCYRYNDNMVVYSWIPPGKCKWYGGEVKKLDKASCTLRRTSENISRVTGSMVFVPPPEAPVGEMPTAPLALVGIAEVRSMELGIGGGVLSFIFNWIAGLIT